MLEDSIADNKTVLRTECSPFELHLPVHCVTITPGQCFVLVPTRALKSPVMTSLSMMDTFSIVSFKSI